MVQLFVGQITSESSYVAEAILLLTQFTTTTLLCNFWFISCQIITFRGLVCKYPFEIRVNLACIACSIFQNATLFCHLCIFPPGLWLRFWRRAMGVRIARWHFAGEFSFNFWSFALRMLNRGLYLIGVTWMHALVGEGWRLLNHKLHHAFSSRHPRLAMQFLHFLLLSLFLFHVFQVCFEQFCRTCNRS